MLTGTYEDCTCTRAHNISCKLFKDRFGRAVPSYPAEAANRFEWRRKVPVATNTKTITDM
eukprot:5779934-Karenia_brevis.AAC.1